VHEQHRRVERVPGGDAQQDAAGSQGVGEEGIAVVSIFAGRAQQRERRLGLPSKERAEVQDLEPLEVARVRQRRLEAAVDEDDAARAGNREQPGREGRGIGAGKRRGVERVFGDARVVEVFPVLVAPVRQTAGDHRVERAGAPARPGWARGRQARTCGGNALEGRRAHAATIPSRSQS
jgi:hypothetical protein